MRKGIKLLSRITLILAVAVISANAYAAKWRCDGRIEYIDQGNLIGGKPVKDPFFVIDKTLENGTVKSFYTQFLAIGKDALNGMEQIASGEPICYVGVYVAGPSVRYILAFDVKTNLAH